jgi:hypothetical protein
VKKQDVRIGGVYAVKVGGNVTRVRIDRVADEFRVGRVRHGGGWYGTNLSTGREVRIRSAARLRHEVAAQP